MAEVILDVVFETVFTAISDTRDWGMAIGAVLALALLAIVWIIIKEDDWDIP